MEMPVLGIILGDASGIGPEIVCKMLNLKKTGRSFKPIIIGSEKVFKSGMKYSGVLEYKRYSDIRDIHESSNLDEIVLYDNNKFEPGELGTMDKQSGNSFIEMIKTSIELANNHIIDAIVYAPINKKLINIANNCYTDELQVFKHLLNYNEFCIEMNYSGNLWTSRVTGHIPLMQVSSYLNINRIVNIIKLTNQSLKLMGISDPLLYVSAINPHGGEGGLFGTEEDDIIIPAVAQAKSEGINVKGPFPADTIFYRAFSGECNAVITMYHDQGQIALKTKCFDGGVTLLAGLPLTVLTTGHGVGYNIAGKGIASYNSMLNAVNIAIKMTRNN